MTRITEFFMQRRTLFWSLMAGIILAGVISFLYMPKLEDPAVPVKQAMSCAPSLTCTRSRPIASLVWL